MQLHLVTELYHLQFSLQAVSPETFGYILEYQIILNTLYSERWLMFSRC